MKWSYENSIVQVSCSLRKYFDLPCVHESHPVVDQWLDDVKPRCIVAILVDGMGCSIAEKAGPEAFVNVHTAMSVRTVYPTTTSAATISFLTGKTPMETGWLGWCQHFEEEGDEVILFRGQSMYTDKKYSNTFGWDKLPVQYLNEELHAMHVPADSLWPKWSAHNPCSDLEDMCQKIVDMSQNHRFLYAYWDELDTWMHRNGPDDIKCADQVRFVDDRLSKLSEALPKDVGLLVVADHGQINVKHRFIPREILDCLVCAPSLETRTMAFFVKPGREKEFEEKFNRAFADSFELVPSSKVVQDGIFGQGQAHARFEEFLGTYVAFAKKDEDLCACDGSARLLGQHAGPSEEEAMVPVVLFPKYREGSI